MAKKLSRAERYEEAIGGIEESQSDIEVLRDELAEWFDNMPENLQASAKADELQEVIEMLEEVISLAEEIVGTEVEFPSMCG